MPTYEYKCSDCNKVIEIFQKITDEPLNECPECGGHIKRLISTGLAPIFKGSGFYQTDYKNKESSKTNLESGKDKTKKSEKPKESGTPNQADTGK